MLSQASAMAVHLFFLVLRRMIANDGTPLAGAAAQMIAKLRSMKRSFCDAL
jgi:hypothetical protein